MASAPPDAGAGDAGAEDSGAGDRARTGEAGRGPGAVAPSRWAAIGWGRAGLALSVALLAAGYSGCAGKDGEDTGSETNIAAIAAAEDAVLDDLTRTLTILQGKMVDLAGAMPEETWDWRPGEGVRSVGQIYSHVAADNYFVAALLDTPVPPETQVSKDGPTVGAYEARVTGRDEVIAGLEASWIPLMEAAAASRGRMGASVDLRGNPLTVADLWVRATVHLHEHLGQAIAYARVNGVTPPWSQ